MGVSARLRRLLTGEYVNYRLVPHRREFAAQEVAAAAHLPGRALAKVVVLRDAAGEFLMVVIPADRRMDLDAVTAATGRSGLRVASEQEFGSLFPDCELGAMPPFGDLYGLPVHVDACLRDQPEIFFRGGSHEELVAMQFSDYESLARPMLGQRCFHGQPPSSDRRGAAQTAAAA